MLDATWIVAHMAMNDAGHTITRFQRPMSNVSPDTTAQYGAWTESRADDAV
jgi:hypothetical protein